jgi:hypothetical protein
MFVQLQSRKEIAEAQHTLETTIRRAFSRSVVKHIGHPGGWEDNAKLATDGHYWFWSKNYRGREVANRRRLNWFGTVGKSTGVSITVEINTSYVGPNDQVAGFFARNEATGAVYLVHSGRVGGGKKGVGKDAFRAWLGEPLVEALDSLGRCRDGLLVMPIEAAGATRSLVHYIDQVSRFKRAVRDGEVQTADFQQKQRSYREFYSEGRGRRRGRRSGQIDYLSRHGDIVDALHNWRRARAVPRGARLVKNVLIDMGVEIGDKLVEVFEVKSDATRSSFYSAFGQLMVHGIARGCHKVMVLPHGEELSSDLRNALRLRGVELLRFKLDDGRTIILGSGWRNGYR